jgi:hypothetical protein
MACAVESNANAVCNDIERIATHSDVLQYTDCTIGTSHHSTLDTAILLGERGNARDERKLRSLGTA